MRPQNKWSKTTKKLRILNSKGETNDICIAFDRSSFHTYLFKSVRYEYKTCVCIQYHIHFYAQFWSTNINSKYTITCIYQSSFHSPSISVSRSKVWSCIICGVPPAQFAGHVRWFAHFTGASKTMTLAVLR